MLRKTLQTAYSTGRLSNGGYSEYLFIIFSALSALIMLSFAADARAQGDVMPFSAADIRI